MRTMHAGTTSLLGRLAARLQLTREELLRVIPTATIPGVLFAVTGVTLATRLGVPAGFLTACAGLVGGATGFIGGVVFVARFANGTARRVGAFVLPSGRTTPATRDFSMEDALVMRRDFLGALASYEAIMAAEPHLVAARLRAADLYAAQGIDPRRAEALFREVQRIPSVPPRDDVYASSRLVDLYTGVLDDTGRALVELRRLVERHAGTRAADDARRGLDALKARLRAEQAEPRA